MNHFIKPVLLDCASATDTICRQIKYEVHNRLKKRGVIVGISGGIDSSVVLALCVKALDNAHVCGLLLPEKESNPDNIVIAKKIARQLNIEYIIEDITAALEGVGCYRRRDAAIKEIFPEYDKTYKSKIALAKNPLKKNSLNTFRLTIIAPDGQESHQRIPPKQFAEIVAASNFKQRTRMMMLYHHAELRNYAVVGTANKNEHELGFFVKYGDGAADIKPIKHLFKTQVFQLAEYLNIPEEIRHRIPSTDIYPAEESQEEFYFRVPFDILDAVWYHWEQGIPSPEIAELTNLTTEQVDNVITDIKRKKVATEYLRFMPV